MPEKIEILEDSEISEKTERAKKSGLEELGGNLEPRLEARGKEKGQWGEKKTPAKVISSRGSL